MISLSMIWYFNFDFRSHFCCGKRPVRNQKRPLMPEARLLDQSPVPVSAAGSKTSTQTESRNVKCVKRSPQIRHLSRPNPRVETTFPSSFVPEDTETHPLQVGNYIYPSNADCQKNLVRNWCLDFLMERVAKLAIFLLKLEWIALPSPDVCTSAGSSYAGAPASDEFW